VTEPVFEAELSVRLEAIGVPRSEAGIWDVAAMRRAKEFDPWFPAERLLPALKETLSGLGIDLDAQNNLHLDGESRPLKSPRASCANTRVPEDVRLVTKPRGGVDGYSSLFHEAGHAELCAHVAAELDFAHRRLGDTSLTGTYAFVLEHLLFSPTWLQGILGLRAEQIEPVIRYSRFHLLWFVRRYGATLNYEPELHAGLVDAKATAYAHWLQQGCKVQVPPQRYLEDVDDHFYGAQYLRAWIFEAQLRLYVELTFGVEWFRQPGAGRFLKDLWHIGQQYPVDELAHQIGSRGLHIAPLVQQLTVAACPPAFGPMQADREQRAGLGCALRHSRARQQSFSAALVDALAKPLRRDRVVVDLLNGAKIRRALRPALWVRLVIDVMLGVDQTMVDAPLFVDLCPSTHRIAGAGGPEEEEGHGRVSPEIDPGMV